MSRRLAWLIGPLGASALLFVVCSLLSRRFEAGLPLGRGIAPEDAAWVSLGATLVVLAIWLVSSSTASADEE
jgi:hypothetical protein